MKKILTASVAAAAMSMFIGGAQAADMDYEQAIQGLVVSGVVESWSGYSFYTNKDFDGDEDDLENSFFSGKTGRLSLPLGSNLSIQMDVDSEFNTSHLVKSNDDNTTNMEFAWQGLVHLSARDPNMGLIGAFGGFGTGAADGGEYPFHVVGGEAQLYLQDFTLYAQGGYFDFSNSDNHDEDGMRDALFARGVVRWFLDDNSRLQGEVSYASGEVDGSTTGTGDDGNVVEWAVRYDTQLSGVPLLGDPRVFLAYRGARFENEDEDNRFTDHTIMAGFRYQFGGNTLREIDRVGATLDAPMIGRWVGSGNIND